MVAQAQSISSDAEVLIREAGEGMILLITRSTWETLVRQASAEDVTPGEVLGKALRFYLEAHGSKEAVEYLDLVARDG